MDHLSQIIEQYGIYAVFVLSTVEGDITLLLSGAMAHGRFFGEYSFLKVFLAGTFGGLVGDSVGYWIGRLSHKTICRYRSYEIARPRIERLIERFGGFSLIISKYIYGIRVAMCIFHGIAKMPYPRFLFLDAISCSVWVLILAGTGYFFSGAITSIIGDFQQIGIALFFVILCVVILIYLVERYWLSEKVEEADPETLHRIEEKFHDIEEAAQEKLHDLSEKLHLTREPNSDDKPQRPETDKTTSAKAAKK